MPARNHKIRVMIADDHAILRAGLRMLIDAQADMEIVSEADDGEKAVRTAKQIRPDVVLLDLTMPRGGGMKALQQLARDCSEIRLLVLTMHDDPAYLRSALAAGASGYLLKRAVDTELIAAIRAVHRGGSTWIRVWRAFLYRMCWPRAVREPVQHDHRAFLVPANCRFSDLWRADTPARKLPVNCL